MKIKNFKDLKRKIEKIRYITGASYCKYIRKSYVFDLLNSFEASLRKQIDVLETIPAESVRHVRAKELRRVLGEEAT